MATHDKTVHCPHCNAHLTHASNATEHEHQFPEPGDATICIVCGEWGIFDPTSRTGLRKPNEDEITEIGLDKDLQRMRTAWVAMDKERRREPAPRNSGRSAHGSWPRRNVPRR